MDKDSTRELAPKLVRYYRGHLGGSTAGNNQWTAGLTAAEELERVLNLREPCLADFETLQKLLEDEWVSGTVGTEMRLITQLWLSWLGDDAKPQAQPSAARNPG